MKSRTRLATIVFLGLFFSTQTAVVFADTLEIQSPDVQEQIAYQPYSDVASLLQHSDAEAQSPQSTQPAASPHPARKHRHLKTILIVVGIVVVLPIVLASLDR